MTYTLRPCVIPDDCARMAEIISSANPEPVTAAQLAERYRVTPTDGVAYRVLASGADGYPVGYGVLSHFPHEAPGRFSLRVITDPAFRGRGAASFLYDHLLTHARQHGARLLESMVRDNAPASLTFAERRGFTVDRHTFESVLDLAAFDAAPFAGAVADSEAAGIRFFSLADDPSPANLRRFYDLVWSVSPDIPGYTFASPPPYDAWAGQVLEGPRVRQDLLLVAAAGERWVGFAINVVSPVTGAVYNGGTGVDRAYRGRGIALALKLLAIRRAKATGAPYMRTNNDAQNAAMLAVNRKLGYQSSPGVYELVKSL